jgi:hypothetical protein
MDKIIIKFLLARLRKKKEQLLQWIEEMKNAKFFAEPKHDGLSKLRMILFPTKSVHFLKNV